MVALAVLELADGGQRQEVDEGVATHTPAFSIQTKSTCCPHGITAPSRRLSGSEVGQRENPLYLRKLWNKDACKGVGISLFVTGFRSARRRSRCDFWSFWTPKKGRGG